MARKLHDITEAFMELSADFPVPEIYRRGCSIFTVGAALSKRCWVETEVGIIFPNMLMLIVGPPSTGKGPPINLAMWLLQGIDFSDSTDFASHGIRLGIDDTTAAGIFDELRDSRSEKSYQLNGKRIKFQNLTIVVEEASTLFHSLDLRMMSFLIKLLNCDSLNQRLRAQKERIIVPSPVMSILGGIQPDVLHLVFPEAAWGMGLTARTVFVFSDEKKKLAPFNLDNLDSEEKMEAKSKVQKSPLFEAIVHDLRDVARMAGKFKMTRSAAAFANEWWTGPGSTERIAHPRLESYSGKRILHFLRFAQIHSAAMTSDCIITLDHAQKALATLTEFETSMGGIFNRMGAEGAAHDKLKDVIHEIEAAFRQTKSALPHYQIMQIIARKFPVYQTKQTFELLIDQGTLKEGRLAKALPGQGGRKGFIPTTVRLPSQD